MKVFPVVHEIFCQETNTGALVHRHIYIIPPPFMAVGDWRFMEEGGRLWSRGTEGMKDIQRGQTAVVSDEGYSQDDILPTHQEPPPPTPTYTPQAWPWVSGQLYQLYLHHHTAPPVCTGNQPTALHLMAASPLPAPLPAPLLAPLMFISPVQKIQVGRSSHHKYIHRLCIVWTCLCYF